MYWDANSLYDYVTLQVLPVYGFKRRIDKSNFDEKFIKNYDENSGKR